MLLQEFDALSLISHPSSPSSPFFFLEYGALLGASDDWLLVALVFLVSGALILQKPRFFVMHAKCMLSTHTF